ncbi:hypothetical protein EST38_g4048 [Candolleomyces aberdarensis]|uniref:Wax synthase domain-containing protein n=1 Tax=Candolleomyces aberdarensis TaxID=2316362 RepID=A0A4Q2DQP2_9AGAR|nr:hypothetical protein EST38_g4048 [Candolleomyces aberdarensis]
MALRCIIWTFRTKPLYRTIGTDSEEPTSPKSYSIGQVAADALELTNNARGIGWNWSKGLYIPEETRPTHSRIAFILSTIPYYLFATIIFDSCHFAVQSFSPSTFGSGVGGTIFDSTLPPLQMYLRSTAITLLSGFTVCYNIQSLYYGFTIISLTLPLGQTPEQWPPIFGAKPWSATSLSEFWSRKWHQLFRDLFVSVGYNPASYLFGHAAGVAAAFFVSTLLHVTGLWGMGRGGEFLCTAAFFMSNAFGIILERLWTRVTGRRVEGVWGNVWTLAWLLMSAQPLVDAWARTGMIGTLFFSERLRPVNLISRAVLGYNVWS